MVYTGKPSGGCKLCRIRKVKCDEAKPFCMRCAKSKRHCPGYGPVVRDQTRTSAEKLKKLRASSTDSTTSVDSSIPFVARAKSAGDCYESTAPLAPPRRHSTTFTLGDQKGDLRLCFRHVHVGLRNPLDEQASCFFLSEFVNVPLTPTARGYYAFLPRFLGREDISTCFSHSYKAASMAALAMRQSKGSRGPALLRAQEHHISALRAVGQAIADPDEINSDQTLGAVLMLAFYEVIIKRSTTAAD